MLQKKHSKKSNGETCFKLTAISQCGSTERTRRVWSKMATCRFKKEILNGALTKTDQIAKIGSWEA